MVSTPTHPKYAAFIVKYKPSVNTKHKFGRLKLIRICMTNTKLYNLTKGKDQEYYKNYDNSK